MDKEIENAAFLIEMARMEYEAEFVRSNRIQEKCGIFLSLMGTFLSIVLVSFPYAHKGDVLNMPPRAVRLNARGSTGNSFRTSRTLFRSNIDFEYSWKPTDCLFVGPYFKRKHIVFMNLKSRKRKGSRIIPNHTW